MALVLGTYPAGIPTCVQVSLSAPGPTPEMTILTPQFGLQPFMPLPAGASYTPVVVEKYDYRYIVRDGYNWGRPYDENASPPIVFHGTSMQLVDSIRQHGLNWRLNPFTEDDMTLMEQLRRHSCYRTSSRAKDLSLSMSFEIALNHAMQGPEAIGCILKELRDHHDAEEIEELAYKIDRGFPARFAALMEKAAAFMAGHRLVLLAVRKRLRLSGHEVKEHSAWMERQWLTSLLEYARSGQTPPMGPSMGPSIELSLGGSQQLDFMLVSTIAALGRELGGDRADDIVESAIRSANYAVHFDRVEPDEIVGFVPVEVVKPGIG
jgi:hypothetical protein